MSKHTAGPWEADRAKMDEGGHYYQIDGQQLVGNIPYTVADTLNRHFCISPEEDAANARLIAAAPKMYEALKRVIENKWEPDKYHMAVFEALQQAEGRQ